MSFKNMTALPRKIYGPTVIRHEDAAVAAVNRFHLPDGKDLVIRADDVACFVYDVACARWRVDRTR